MHHRRRRSRGLTLIEIVVVITIVSMMMTAVTVYAVGVLEESRRKQARLDTKNLVTALDMYRVAKGHFPEPQRGLAALVETKVIKDLPKDPWGGDYAYSVEDGEAVVVSLGADGVPGGEGRDADVSSRERE